MLVYCYEYRDQRSLVDFFDVDLRMGFGEGTRTAISGTRSVVVRQAS